MSKLAEWLSANFLLFSTTGSQHLFGEGEDYDYVLCVDDIPEDLRGELLDLPETEYRDFYNLKFGNGDYIICKTVEQLAKFNTATRIAKEIESRGGPLSAILRHKGTRSEFFNCALTAMHFYEEQRGDIR